MSDIVSRRPAASGLRAVPEPVPLPFCAYPTAADIHSHGLQPLPAALPPASFAGAARHRTRRCGATPLSRLTTEQVLEAARVVAQSFARREPQCRHLQLPAAAPDELATQPHADEFGTASFGPWTRPALLYWFIRLFVLTDPASPAGAIVTRRATLQQSLALVDDEGRILGAAFNETLAPSGADAPLRTPDPFLTAVLAGVGPILDLLSGQSAAALAALCERYPQFAAALGAGRVGHHFMVARGETLSAGETFELVVASAERYRALGFRYMVVEATNQWTGAACEALGAVRVHFAPFRRERRVPAAQRPLACRASSSDGFVAAKDSGSMFYVLWLA